MAKTTVMQMMTVAVAVAVAVAMLVNGIAAKKLVVGGDDGWTVPSPSSPDFYTTWAAKQNFTVGDILVFEFATDFHTVAIVTLKDSYNKCNVTLDKNSEVITDGPYERNLTTSGLIYFFCTVGSHCLNGLKFTANVSASVAKSPPAP